MMKKIIDALEKILLLNFAVFLIIVPYSTKFMIKICLYSGILLWIALNILKHKKRFFRGFVPETPLNKYFLLFGAACLLSIIFSLDPYHSQGIFFERFLLFLLFFWMGAGLGNNKKNFNFLISAFILSSLIMAIGGIRDYIIYLRINPLLTERIWSAFGKRIDYYGFPLYMTYFIPINFAVFVFAKRKLFRITGFINLGLLLFCLLRNGSRIGMVAVIVSLIFISLLKRKKFLLISLTILAASIMTIILSSVSPTETLEWRIKTIFTPSEWSFRLPLYKSAISITRDYPLIGSGLGMYEKLLHTPDYELPNDYPIPKIWNLHAHNTYLETASEMGIIGITCFLLIFIVFFIKSIRIIILRKTPFSENSQAVFLGLMGTILAILIFAFGSTIITVGLSVSGYFWFLFGISAGYLDYLLKETKNITPDKK